MSNHAISTIIVGDLNSKEDCKGIAGILIECKDIHIRKLLVERVDIPRGYREEYITEPTIADFLTVIEKNGFFEVEVESRWYPPNKMFKNIIKRYPNANMYNDWWVPSDNGCDGNDEWNIDTVDDYEDQEEY